MFREYEDIKPQYISKEDGPYGKIFEEDHGFTADEWASIPPIPDSMKGIGIEEYNMTMSNAINSLLIEANFQLLNKTTKEAISILRYGYNYEGHDCTKEAVANWLTAENVKKFNRLDWEEIEKTFPRHSEGWIREELEWAESVGVKFKKNWEYKKPRVQWAYWGHEYFGAHWNVNNIE